MYDLAVIGGGPAGSAAAITAARAGVRVLLLERGRFPRHKVCGEFVSAESLSILSSLLSGGRSTEPGLVPTINKARLFVDNSVLTTEIDPAAASISRYDLDESLWRAAVLSGVDARQQVTVTAIRGAGPFELSTSAGEFPCRGLINASGRWSNLSQHTQPANGGPEKWIGLKAHFAETEAPASVDLYFFENGYCGVQPVRQECEVNVCAMVRSDVATSLPQVLAKHPALQERASGWRQTTETVSTSPLVFRTPEAVRENVFNVGDAAGFVDPFVGDGISLALRGGTLAAESLIPFWRGTTSLQIAAETYNAVYTDRLLPVFRTSSKIRRLLALPAPARAVLVILFGNLPALTRYLVRRTR